MQALLQRYLHVSDQGAIDRRIAIVVATTLERGPGSSDVDWISHLATTQAKFIRDVTAAWTSAARDVLK